MKSVKSINKNNSKTPANTVKSDVLTKYFILTTILFLTIIVFSNSINNEFVAWDDNEYITENNLIKDLSFHGIKNIFSTPVSGHYSPLTTLSWAIEYHFWGMKPTHFHLVNLIFHLMNIVLVFVFISNLQGFKNLEGLIVAVLFAIHPMHIESVSWATERKDVLYAFFFLLSIIFWLKSWKVGKLESSKPQLSIINYQLSILFFLLSLLSKSMAVTLPLIFILIDYYKGKINLQFTPDKIGIQFLKKYIPFFVLSVITGIVAMYSAKGALHDTPVFTIFDSIFLASYGVVYYLFHLFVPTNLAALHPYPVKENGILPMEYYLSFFFILIMIFGIYKSHKIPLAPFKKGELKKNFVFGFLFFIITLLPVLQLLPVGIAIVSERYTYISYIGLFLIIGQVSSIKYQVSSIKYAVISVFVGGIIIFSVISFNRNKVWKNSMTLFTDMIEKHPNAESAHYNRGLTKYHSKDFQGAILDFDNAIKINAASHNAFNNRGLARNELRDFTGALSDYNKSIELKSDFETAYNNRAICKGSTQDFQGAINDLDKAIELKSDYAEAYSNRGNAKGFLRDFVGSINDFNKSLELNPNDGKTLNNRAISKFNLNDKSGACDDLKRAAALGYSDAVIMFNKNCK